jgi:hypothetical protein
MPYTDDEHKSSAPLPCVCPHCGHVHAAFDEQASAALDCLTIATDALRDLRLILEAEVLP